MKKQKFKKGFTLIEMIIVFSLIGILVGMSIPQFRNATKKARETMLKDNLFKMRTLIQHYYTDKLKYPISLQALVDDEYLMFIPIDPITRSYDTWLAIEEILTEDDLFAGVIPGIANVQSGSDQKALDGTFFNTW